MVAVMPAAVALLVFDFLREFGMFCVACLVFGLLNEAIRVNPGKWKCELNAKLLLIEVVGGGGIPCLSFWD